MKISIIYLVILSALIGCSTNEQYPCSIPVAHKVNQQAMNDLTTLSSAQFRGRKPKSPGSRLAQQWLIEQYSALNLLSFNEQFSQVFERGTNIVGWMRGSSLDQQYIVHHARLQSSVCLTSRKRFNSTSMVDKVDLKRASDHWVFTRQHIDYLYIGGMPHADYHLPSDTVAKISPLYFTRVVQSVEQIFRVIELTLSGSQR